MRCEYWCGYTQKENTENLKRVSETLQVTSAITVITGRQKQRLQILTLHRKVEETSHFVDPLPSSYAVPSSLLFTHFKPKVLVSFYPQLCGYACTRVPLNHDMI